MNTLPSTSNEDETPNVSSIIVVDGSKDQVDSQVFQILQNIKENGNISLRESNLEQGLREYSAKLTNNLS